MEEQLDLFEARLRESLQERIRSITLSHIHQIHNFLQLPQELVVKIDSNMQGVAA